MHNSQFVLLVGLQLCQNLFAQDVPSKNTQNPDLDKLVDKCVSEMMTENSCVGVSIGIVSKGDIRHYHYGSSKVGQQSLPDNETVYEIASLTKTFTGALLAKAISENRISLSDDIRKFLKEPYPNLEFEGKSISIRDLIAHQSGLPRSIPFDPKMWEDPDFEALPHQIIKFEGGYTPQDWLRELHDVKLTRTPGSMEFEYSNIGVNLVAIALENVYSRSYEQLIEETFFAPLEMGGSKFLLAEVPEDKLATGYFHNGKAMPYIPDNTRAAGGIKSNLNDMLRYVAFQLNETDLMVQVSHRSVWDSNDKTHSRGLGWQIFQNDGLGRCVYQNGGAFGFTSTIMLYPEKNLGFVILSNTAGPNLQNSMGELAEEIAAKLK